MRLRDLFLPLAVVAGLGLAVEEANTCPDCPPAPLVPAPDGGVPPRFPPDTPQPTPPKKPTPLRPWDACACASVEAPCYCDCSNGGPCSCGVGCTCALKKVRVFGQDDTTEPAVDLLVMPRELRLHNITAKGSGCCTFRSADYASHWQNVPAIHGLPEWLKNKGYAGGGNPSKQARIVEECARDRGMPVPGFVQYEGNSCEIIELALKTGRLPCITWQGNHMLCCVYLDSSKAAILDNNDPHRLHWYDRKTFERKFVQGGGGWVFVLTAPAPSPPPRAANSRPPLQSSLAPATLIGDEYRWEKGTLPGNWLLFCRDRQIGIWFEGRYTAVGTDAAKNKEQILPPIEPPSDTANFGVEEWTRSEGEAFYLNGKMASKADVFAALQDDSSLAFLTIIGQEAERKKVLQDLDTLPSLSQWKSKLRIQSYSPDNWAVKFGFVANGRPNIYLQTATGQVLHRQDDYTDAGVGLFGALRRADPNYDPAKDPDLRKPAPTPPTPPTPPVPPTPGKSKLLLFLDSIPGWAWLAGLAAAYLFMNRQTPPPAKV